MMINLDIYHISFEEVDIMRALCITDTESKKSEFYQVIDCLHDIQLIKCARYNSREVKEVAHDCVAKIYGFYTKAEMPVEVRTVLDVYAIEYLKGTSINQKIDAFREKSGKHGMAIWILILAVIICLTSCICRPKADNEVLFAVGRLSVVSVIYVYTFYRHITGYHPDKKYHYAITISFLISMISGAVTIVLYEHWLACLCVDGVYWHILCCNRYG